MKLKFLFVVVVMSALVLSAVVFRKEFVLDMLVVELGYFNSSDLIVVLEGGSVRFAPTQERVNKAIELYKQYSSSLMVCVYAEHRPEIIKKLFSNGIDHKQLIETNYIYEGKKGGGTYNNIMEIISAIKLNDNLNNIVVVTSPYHELRVSLVFLKLFKTAKINRPINLRFEHIEHSELVYTDTVRFIRVLSHELFGILGFYLDSYQDALMKMFIPSNRVLSGENDV